MSPIACRSHERHDEQALRLEVRSFNNFLRESIRCGELRAGYDVLHQHRQLARVLALPPRRLRARARARPRSSSGCPAGVRGSCPTGGQKRGSAPRK